MFPHSGLTLRNYVIISQKRPKTINSAYSYNGTGFVDDDDDDGKAFN